ncbi:MAG TPA: oligosaccharide flippase family protein [Candidatus Cloacimonadota bacterium]|nr:oligosaccharide flippase family protein [Candidatus Cloacimonadota bacterium]HQL14899.1 oligosaccharide flippase family protein [Candidatus Cloacimonadota bacterium]
MAAINLKKNIAFSSSSQVLTIIASFIANVFLSRFLGPDLRGRYVYLFTINSVIWLLLDFGIAKSFVYSLQHDKADPKKLYSFTLLFFLISTILLAFVFGFILPAFTNWNDQHYSNLILTLLGIYIAAYILFTRQRSLFMALNKIEDYAALSCLPTIAFLIILLPSFWLVPKAWRMEYAYFLNVITFIICILIFHFRLSRQINLQWEIDKPLIKRSYSLGWKAFLSEYLIILMTRVDQLVLKSTGSFKLLGIYSLSVNFVDMINTICNMIGVVLLTKFTSLDNDNEALTILRKIFLLVIAFNIFCIIAMLVLGRPVISLLYGKAYLGAYNSFIFLIPAIFGLTLGALFNTFLWSKGFPIFTILAPAMPIVLKIVLSYFLIPNYGYYGAAISSSLCYPLWLIILMLWYFLSHPEQKVSQLIPRKQDAKDTWKMFLEVQTQLLARL